MEMVIAGGQLNPNAENQLEITHLSVRTLWLYLYTNIPSQRRCTGKGKVYHAPISLISIGSKELEFLVNAHYNFCKLREHSLKKRQMACVDTYPCVNAHQLH